MKGTRRGKSRRGGISSGCGNFQGIESSENVSPSQSQPIRITEISLETEQSSNPRQGPLSSEPLQRTSPETESSRNLEESICPSPEVETGAGTRFLSNGA